MDIITYFLLVILSILLGLGIMWEKKDYGRIEKSPKVYHMNDLAEREEWYKFYASFQYQNTVCWRSNYISAVAATFVLYFILGTAGVKLSIRITIIMLLIIFLIFYFADNFKTFHFWRVISSKVVPEINPI